jgi:RimJ/RimL family protein N-acetyltransferase
MMGSMSEQYWPLFGLRVRTPRLELRYPTDDDLVAVVALAAVGIHDADTMPFYVPWTRAESPELERGMLQYFWSQRGALSPTRWSLPLVVFEGRQAVGIQDLMAEQFPVTRAVETGSWLVRRAQGRGLGKEMRAAMLHLAFEGLGAAEAYSASFEDNAASDAVSRANGYEANGSALFAREGSPARSMKWILTRAGWEPRRRDDIEITGLQSCRTLLGAT